MAQLNKMFDEFNDQYGIETQLLDHNLDGMVQIVGSEFDEWTEEITEPLFGSRGFIPKPENFVKEGLDVVYAMIQQLRERGVDVDAGLAEVHRSNMSKIVEASDLESELAIAKKRYPDVIAHPIGNELFVLKSPSQGKVVKPTCYIPAVITEAIINDKGNHCFKDRLHSELSDLILKRDKLSKFISGDKPDFICSHNWILMSKQLDVMNKYINILECRINIVK